MNKGTQLFGAAAAYSEDLFSKFGGLKSNARNEDQILPFRASLLGKIGYIKEPLIKYRVHGNNLSFWVQMKEVNYNEFIELERKNFSNQIINLENFIEDILKINNDILKINIVRNKIEKLQLYKNLLSKNIFIRIYLLSRAIKLINKINIVMLFSPRLYYFIIVRKLNK